MKALWTLPNPRQKFSLNIFSSRLQCSSRRTHVDCIIEWKAFPLRTMFIDKTTRGTKDRVELKISRFSSQSVCFLKLTFAFMPPKTFYSNVNKNSGVERQWVSSVYKAQVKNLGRFLQYGSVQCRPDWRLLTSSKRCTSCSMRFYIFYILDNTLFSCQLLANISNKCRD